MSSEWLARVVEQLGALGLGPVGVLSAARFDALAGGHLRAGDLSPGARAVLVVGSGGRRLWEGFVQAVREDPRALTGQPHPLDAFVSARLERLRPLLEEAGPCRVVSCGAQSEVFLDFRALAVASGLGAVGPLGLLVHPTFGPWMALRAAIFTPALLEETLPLPSSPCHGCPAPCVGACPAGAVRQEGFDLPTCINWHTQATTCEATCLARGACIAGPGHRYEPLQRLYHDHRRAGRAALRALLQVEGDLFEGKGPW